MSRFTLINKTLSYACVTEWWLFSPVPIYFWRFCWKVGFPTTDRRSILWIIKDGFIDIWNSDNDNTCGNMKHIMRHGCGLTGFPPFFLNFQRTTSPVWKEDLSKLWCQQSHQFCGRGGNQWYWYPGRGNWNKMSIVACLTFLVAVYGFESIEPFYY